MSYSLDPDQAGHFVGPDLDSNYLQRLEMLETGNTRSPRVILPLQAPHHDLCITSITGFFLQDTGEQKALKRDCIYNVDMLF